MWNRQEIKEKGKNIFKANYWKAVGASLVMLFLNGAFNSSRANKAKEDFSQVEQSFSLDQMMMFVTGVLFVWLFAIVLAILFSVFLKNPLKIGTTRMILNLKDNKAEFSDILSVFRNSYTNVVLIVFLKDLFIGLWTLLLIVPGIIKSYEYRMVDYILAENPEISREEAFARSREMMDGNKWDAFVFDLSFLGWHILGMITFGLVEIFYAAPYHFTSNAELYETLKGRS